MVVKSSFGLLSGMFLHWRTLLPILEPAWDLVRQRLDGHLFPSLRLRLLPSQQQEAEHRTLCPRVLTYWHGAGIAGVDRKILERTSYHQ